MRTITFSIINITHISKVKVVLINLGKTLIILFLKILSTFNYNIAPFLKKILY